MRNVVKKSVLCISILLLGLTAVAGVGAGVPAQSRIGHHRAERRPGHGSRLRRGEQRGGLRRLGTSGVDVVYLHDADGFPFDGALVDIARTYDAATARWVAKSLQYPKVPLDSTSYRVWPWSLTFRPLAVGVLAMGAALGLVHLRRGRRVPATSARASQTGA